MPCVRMLNEASLLLIRTYGLHVKTHDRKPEHVACMRILNCPLQLRARSSTLRASWRQAVACMSISHRQCPQLTTDCRGLQSRPAQLASSFDGLYSELKTHILAHLPVCLRVGLRVAGHVRGVQAEHSKDLRCLLACSVTHNSVQGLLQGTELQLQLVDTFVGFQQGRVLGIVACGSRKLNSLAMNDLLWGFLVIRDFGKTVAPLSVKEGGDLTWRGTYRALLHKRQLRRSAVRQLFRIPFPLNPLAPWTPQGGGGGRQPALDPRFPMPWMVPVPLPWGSGTGSWGLGGNALPIDSGPLTDGLRTYPGSSPPRGDALSLNCDVLRGPRAPRDARPGLPLPFAEPPTQTEGVTGGIAATSLQLGSHPTSSPPRPARSNGVLGKCVWVAWSRLVD